MCLPCWSKGGIKTRVPLKKTNYISDDSLESYAFQQGCEKESCDLVYNL